MSAHATTPHTTLNIQTPPESSENLTSTMFRNYLTSVTCALSNAIMQFVNASGLGKLDATIGSLILEIFGPLHSLAATAGTPLKSILFDLDSKIKTKDVYEYFSWLQFKLVLSAVFLVELVPVGLKIAGVSLFEEMNIAYHLLAAAPIATAQFSLISSLLVGTKNLATLTRLTLVRNISSALLGSVATAFTPKNQLLFSASQILPNFGTVAYFMTCLQNPLLEKAAEARPLETQSIDDATKEKIRSQVFKSLGSNAVTAATRMAIPAYLIASGNPEWVVTYNLLRIATYLLYPIRGASANASTMTIADPGYQTSEARDVIYNISNGILCASEAIIFFLFMFKNKEIFNLLVDHHSDVAKKGIQKGEHLILLALMAGIASSLGAIGKSHFTQLKGNFTIPFLVENLPQAVMLLVGILSKNPELTLILILSSWIFTGTTYFSASKCTGNKHKPRHHETLNVIEMGGSMDQNDPTRPLLPKNTATTAAAGAGVASGNTTYALALQKDGTAASEYDSCPSECSDLDSEGSCEEKNGSLWNQVKTQCSVM